MSHLAPLQPGSFFTGYYHQARRDVLGLLMESTRTHGDVVRFQFGPLHVHLINHPDYIAHVLVGNRDNYDKASRSSANLGLICGASILTTNGPAWQWRRKIVQPMFHHAAVAGFIETIGECTQAMLVGWQKKARAGESVEIASEMMRLTFRIVGRCLFGTDLEEEALAVERAMHTLMAHTYARWRRILNPPLSWPTPENRRFRAALAEVDAVISQIIKNHRAHPPAQPNMLTMLMNGRDAETGEAVSDEQVRNEAITFLLAGHETTANALAWTFYLLCENPSIAKAIREETTAVCGESLLRMEDLPKLEKTLHAFEEAIRLYPPIWAMERRVILDDEIGGYFIPRGSSLIVSPYALHRHPEFWQEPEAFRPERFVEREHAAYLPFGEGSRSCIGRELALAEARMIVPMVLRAFDLTLVPGQMVVPEPAITLRIKNGLTVNLRER